MPNARCIRAAQFRARALAVFSPVPSGLRSAAPSASSGSPSRIISAPCSSIRAIVAPANTIGEAHLMANNLSKAEEHLAALQQICLLPCEEFDDLKKAVAEYRAHVAK